MLDVYLLRHGETAWNAAGNKYCGRTDLPLTEQGIRQAERAGKNLKNTSFDGVYASPLQRAVRTARIAGEGREVVIDDRLIELDFGNWEGKTKEEFIPANKALWEDWMRDPGDTKAGGTGETAGDAVKRADDFFNSLLKARPSGKVLVVGHNGINRLYLSFKLGMPLKNYRKFFLDNAAVTWFTLDESGALTLKCLNGTL